MGKHRLVPMTRRHWLAWWKIEDEDTGGSVSSVFSSCPCYHIDTGLYNRWVAGVRTCRQFGEIKNATTTHITFRCNCCRDTLVRLHDEPCISPRIHVAATNARLYLLPIWHSERCRKASLKHSVWFNRSDGCRPFTALMLHPTSVWDRSWIQAGYASCPSVVVEATVAAKCQGPWQGGACKASQVEGIGASPSWQSGRHRAALYENQSSNPALQFQAWYLASLCT